MAWIDADGLALPEFSSTTGANESSHSYWTCNVMNSV